MARLIDFFTGGRIPPDDPLPTRMPPRTRRLPEALAYSYEEYRIAYDLLPRERGTVTGRARELLEAHLTPGQQAMLKRAGMIMVTGSHGGSYTLSGLPGSCQVATADGTTKFCVDASGYNGEYGYYCPLDSALAILLTIRTEEERFLRIAIPFH